MIFCSVRPPQAHDQRKTRDPSTMWRTSRTGIKQGGATYSLASWGPAPPTESSTRLHTATPASIERYQRVRGVKASVGAAKRSAGFNADGHYLPVIASGLPVESRYASQSRGMPWAEGKETRGLGLDETEAGRPSGLGAVSSYVLFC